jgi:hypothetical protein
MAKPAKPKDVITITNSKLKSFTRCQRQYYYKFVLNLEAKRKRESLERGTLTHQCLEAYYRNGSMKAMIPVLKDYRKKLKKMFDEERVLFENIPNEVITILRGYHRVWKDTERLEILEYDGEPVIERTFKIPLTSKVQLGFTMDLGVKDELGIWVMDHKTAKNLPSDDFRLTDTQSELYQFGLEEVLDTKVQGIIWNYIRTKVPTVPELLKRGGLTKRKNIDTDRYTYLKAIKEHGLDPADYQDILSTLPTSKAFYNRIRCPRNTNLMIDVVKSAGVVGTRIHNLQEADKDKYVRSLSFMCDRGCEFRPLCIAEMMGHDVDFTISTYYQERKEDKYGDFEEE